LGHALFKEKIMIHTRAERLRTPDASSAGRARLHLVAMPAVDRWPETPERSKASISPETGIGHLDAAAALGRDPFKSPIRLWMERTGRQDLVHPKQLQDEGLGYWSRLLEPIVAAHYTQRTGRKVRQVNATLQHPKHPWMCATITREVMASPEVQLLECLCAGMNVAPLWADGVPEYVRLRVLHLLAVTGKQAADVAVLLGGEDLQIYRIERDEAEIARLIKAQRVFWRGVELDRAPPARDDEVPMP
jgi:putative phage-type endonuclease